MVRLVLLLRPRHLFRLTGALALTAIAFAAQAQTPAGAPLNNPSARNPEQDGQALVFTAAAGVGYDNNVVLDVAPLPGMPGTPPPLAGVGFGQASGQLHYTLKQPRLAFVADTGTFLSRYASELNPILWRQYGTVAADVAVSRHTQLQLTQSLWLRPYYLIESADAVAAASSSASTSSTTASSTSALITTPVNTLTASTGAELSHSLSARTSLAAGYAYDNTNAPDAQFDLRVHEGYVSASRRVGRRSTIEARYSHGQGAYGDEASRETAALDHLAAGFTYRRPLPSSRQTTLALWSGATSVKTGEDVQLVMTGHVAFTRDVFRSWSVLTSYERSVDMFEAFRRPVLTDTGLAGLSGFVNRRVSVSGTAAAVFGHAGVSSDRDPFHLYRGGAEMNVTLTPRVALAAAYHCDVYRFGAAAVLPSGLARRINRQAVSVRVVTLLPLFGGGRSRNASR